MMEQQKRKITTMMVLSQWATYETTMYFVRIKMSQISRRRVKYALSMFACKSTQIALKLPKNKDNDSR